ncbi:DUF58 domain-containing protein [Rhodobacter sp. NSM]|uniref:DUF58 domain-containing protein n=1 Tax=Rhodobacter sp. NSM TaxID=3457501 RepID=UPI003FD3C0B7
MGASAHEVTVARLLALAPVAARKRRTAPELARRPGSTATRPRGQGHEIREIRPFTEGDDLRHLDAAATARTGALQVRSFHEDRDRTVVLVADFRRPMLWGTQRFRSVAAAEALALAGWHAVNDGGSAGAVALTDAGLQSSRASARAMGMARAAGCLVRAHGTALASLSQPVRDLGPDLLRAGSLAPRGATILLATALDRPGPMLAAAVGTLLRRGPLRLLLMVDPFEIDPPATILPFLTEGGRTRRGAFRDLPGRRAATMDELARLGVTVEQVATDVPAEEQP